MICKICQLNSKIVAEIEECLSRYEGALLENDKERLALQFPEAAETIKSLSEQDCMMHFNFHQRITRMPIVKEKKQNEQNISLADDIGKDEAAVLYDLLNSQAATFNVLNNRIAKQIAKVDEEDRTSMLIHPNTMQFYKETADSIRATVKAIGELNVALNGQKDGSLEGLKALAGALLASRAAETPKVATHPQDDPVDGTTTMFD